MLKCGIYDFVICCGGTDMCFVLGFGRKRPVLKQYCISGLIVPSHSSCDYASDDEPNKTYAKLAKLASRQQRALDKVQNSLNKSDDLLVEEMEKSQKLTENPKFFSQSLMIYSIVLRHSLPIMKSYFMSSS